jgi:hypothetical protein
MPMRKLIGNFQEAVASQARVEAMRNSKDTVWDDKSSSQVSLGFDIISFMALGHSLHLSGS